MLYIAYGSNINLAQMAHRCPSARVAGPADLKGFDLLFRGHRHSAVATVEPLGGGSVPVLLWHLGKKDEQTLDRYEGWPRLYRKEIHKVEFEGKTRPAMLYVMNRGHDFGDPSDRYYNTIREGYKSAGFDTGYLDRAVENSSALALEQDRQHYEMDMEPDELEEMGLDGQFTLFDMRWW